MRRVLPDFERSGAGIVAVLPQGAAAVRAYLRRHPLPFPVIADEDRSRCRAWGVYHGIGIDAFRTARPASFVVDSHGVVRYVFVGSHQLQAAPLAPIREALGLESA